MHLTFEIVEDKVKDTCGIANIAQTRNASLPLTNYAFVSWNIRWRQLKLQGQDILDHVGEISSDSNVQTGWKFIV